MHLPSSRDFRAFYLYWTAIFFLFLTIAVLRIKLDSKDIHMKKFIIAVLLFASVFSLSAQNVINFDMTLEKLSTLVAEGKTDTINPNQYMIIGGTVSAREVLNPDKNNFSAVLELSAGQWEGTEKIDIYHCYVQLDGSEFVPMIPVRRSRKPNPAEIKLNSKVLILAKYLGYNEDEKGNKIPVLQGIKVRKNL